MTVKYGGWTIEPMATPEGGRWRGGAVLKQGQRAVFVPAPPPASMSRGVALAEAVRTAEAWIDAHHAS